jgi:hypothetical protein
MNDPNVNNDPTQQVTNPSAPQQDTSGGGLVANAQQAANDVQQQQPQAQAPQQTAQTPVTAQPHPVHQSAGRTIMQALSGIPRSRPYVDTGTGEQVTIHQGNTYRDTKTKQIIQGPKPPSVSDSVLALVASSLAGAFRGASVPSGPNAKSRAFAAGGLGSMSDAEKQDQEAKQQASQDYVRKLSVFEANQRAMNNAIVYSRANREDHDAMVASHKSYLDDIAETAPDMLVGYDAPLSEKDAMDIKKYPPQDYMRVPAGTSPRLDDNGKPVYVDAQTHLVVPEGTPGSYQPTDNTYVLVNNNAKTNISDENSVKPWAQEAVTKWSGIVPGASPALLSGDGAKGQVSAYIAGRMMFQVNALDRLQSELNTFAQTLNDGKGKNDPTTKPVDLKSAIKNNQLSLKDVENFQRAAASSTQPDTQLDTLRQQHPESTNKLMSLFGSDNLENYKQLRENRKLASKIGTEEATKLPFDINKETRVEANKEQLEKTKQDEKDKRTSVYAEDAQGNLVYSNRYDAEHTLNAAPNAIEEMKPSDINKDRAAMRMLNDVQTNVNYYRQAVANDLPKVTATDRDKMQEVFALNQQNGGNLVSFGQGGVSLNIPVISAKLSKKNYAQLADDLQALSPSARNMMNGYLRISAAVPAYQKALTGIGRSNKEMLDLELNNVPLPYFDANTVKERTDAFQQNVDQAASGFPKNLPGIQHPSAIRDKVGNTPVLPPGLTLVTK